MYDRFGMAAVRGDRGDTGGGDGVCVVWVCVRGDTGGGDGGCVVWRVCVWV